MLEQVEKTPVSTSCFTHFPSYYSTFYPFFQMFVEKSEEKIQ
jgi:hypothetical protein